MKEIVLQVIDAYGDIRAVMKAHDLQDPQAVYNWQHRGIPYAKIQKIHKDTGIPLDRLIVRSDTAA